MFFSLAYAVVCLLLETLAINARPNAGLSAEVLALHHQLRVLERQVGRPRWQPADRVLLAATSQALPRPETLLRWHRELVRRRLGPHRRRPRRQRPFPRSEFHVPIELPTSEVDAVSATGPPPTKAAARSPREFGFGLSAISKPDLVDQVLTQEVLEPGRWCNAR